MNLSQNSISIKSSLLNDEMLAQRRKNERKALAIGILAQLIWAFNGIQLKTYRTFFPDAFSNNSLVMWRSIPIWGLGYFFSKRKGLTITPHSQIKHKFWFFSRSLGNYFAVVLWISMLHYFRVSTCQCIAGCHPILIIYLSVFILKESFYMRYLVGVFISILGTAIIVSNDKTEKSAAGEEATTGGAESPLPEKEGNSLLAGLTLIIGYLIVCAFCTFGQKILCKQNMNGDVQNYYLGMYNTLPALMMVIIEWHSGLSNIWYVLYGLSNGFLFYFGNYYTAEALDNIALSKFIPITYMCIIFLYILGFILLGEKVYFTDIVGSMFIMGFQLFNVWVPIKKTPKNDMNNQTPNTPNYNINGDLKPINNNVS